LILEEISMKLLPRRAFIITIAVIAFVAAMTTSTALAQEDITPPDDVSPPDFPFYCYPVGGGDISEVMPPDDMTSSEPEPASNAAGVPAQEDLTPPGDTSGPIVDDDGVVCTVPDLAETGGLPDTGVGSDGAAPWLRVVLFALAAGAMLIVAAGAALSVKRSG
jgi:hypothetical protein